MLKINCPDPGGCELLGRIFLFLAVATSVVALRPRWRNRWAWGRSGGKVALSAFGWLAWAFVFLAISASAFHLVRARWIIAAAPEKGVARSASVSLQLGVPGIGAFGS